MLKHYVCSKNTEIVSWFTKELEFFKGSTAIYLSGVCLGLLATAVGLTSHLGVFDSDHVKWFIVFILFTSHFWAGAGLCMMFSLGKTFYRLGNLPECTIRVENHEFGILGVGSALFKCWVIFVIVWVFFQYPLFLILLSDSAKLSLPIMLLTIPTAIIIFSSLIICQFPLHRRMVQYKQNEINKLQALLEKLTPRNVEDISEELIKSNMFLEEKYKNTLSLPIWPSARFVASGGIVLTSQLPMLLPHLIKIVTGTT